METSQGLAPSGPLPRITIKFCTQCKWMLRAAYFAQELLSTFSTDLGEVSLQPSTGGVFTIEIFYTTPPSPITLDGKETGAEVTVQSRILWDRKVEGGFPETKEIKRRVRDIIDPNRDLGHVDGKKKPGVEHGAALGGDTASKVTSQNNLATGRPVDINAGGTRDAVHSSAHGGAEDEIIDHEELSLEAQPGGKRYKVAERQRGSVGEETGTEGVICDTVRDEKKQNPDGTICDDCS